MTREEYKETLVAMVKACGEELIERAEDLVGECDGMTDFDIHICFPTSNYSFDGVPTIEVTRELCSKKATDVLIQKFM